MKVKLISITPDAEATMVQIARVSSPNPDNQDTKLLHYCINHKHWSVFEHAHATIEIETSRTIGRQILRHRSFSFSEFCVSWDTQISCGGDADVRLKTISELYLMQYNKLWHRKVRVYRQDIGWVVSAKVKEVFKTGIKDVFLLTLENNNKIKATLDHKFLTLSGFKRLQDLDSSDAVACTGKTVTYSPVKDIKPAGREETYDMQIEHADHNYVANGMITHNSQRYAAVIEYEEVEARKQAEKNRQSSTDDLNALTALWFKQEMKQLQDATNNVYNKALTMGIAKETARFALLEVAHTRMYMTGNIRSWIHYLQLRCAEDTQLEHREIAKAIRKVLYKHLPTLANALEE